MIKKYIIGALIALSLPALFAYAATPILNVSGNGDNNNVTVTVSGGEPNAPVVLFYNPTTAGTVQRSSLGYTDQNGNWTGTVSSNVLGIPWNTPVYVQVGGYQSLTSNWSQSGNSTGSNGTIGFSQSSPTIGLGQNGAITLSGGNGTYYVSSNSNMTGVSPVISGNTLTLYGSQAGQANIVVCSTGGGCGTINATVNGGSTSGSTSSGSPVVSQSLLNVGSNGQGSITLSGGSGPYTISVPTGSGITTTLVGNTLYVNGGTNTGANTIQVCSANNQGCTPVTVNVQSSGTSSTSSTSSTNNGTLSFALPINVGSPTQITLTGGSGSYYLASPMSSPALASISGNTLTLNGSAVGSGTITVCSTSGGSCLPIALTVNPALTGTGGGYFFETDLSMGMTSQDVMELQSRLASEGYFQAAPTGYFGPITFAAVQSYQAAHGISATGYVGPLTRAELNR
jgi:peptidoglycan hydrolase-like protein with peptidoglycan-binding domain